MVTYNFPHIALNVVCSNVMGRNSGTDDNNFLPGVVLCVCKLGRMDNLTLEAFLRLRRGRKF